MASQSLLLTGKLVGDIHMGLSWLSIPMDDIGLIVAVDRLFDMGRTCMNVTGDISCSLCVTKWQSKQAKR